MDHLILAGLIPFAIAACAGQTDVATMPASSMANAPYVATMTFDAASVRENKEIDSQAGFIVGGRFVPHTTTFRATNWDIENLISLAYGVDRYQIVGVPKWPWPTMFVIDAKGDNEANAKMATLSSDEQLAEQRHMLRALLEDRFSLRTHWEAKESDVYNLVVAKGDPKLSAEGSIPPSADELKNFGNHPVPMIYQKNDEQGYDLIAHGCSMARLAEILTGQFGRPVIDKTGLTGKYDFLLKYKGRWDRDRDADDMDPTPPMDRALQEQLGLKVNTAKGSIKTLVIDHIEKPSAN